MEGKLWLSFILPDQCDRKYEQHSKTSLHFLQIAHVIGVYVTFLITYHIKKPKFTLLA